MGGLSDKPEGNLVGRGWVTGADIRSTMADELRILSRLASQKLVNAHSAFCDVAYFYSVNYTIKYIRNDAFR